MPKDRDIRCKCRKCNHSWSYKLSEEHMLKEKARMGDLICDDGICGNPYGNLYLNDLMDANDNSDEFDKCPKCGSKEIEKRNL